MKTYAEKLKDPRWQKRRLELFDKAGWACGECGTKTDTLCVHHGYYERGVEPWEYPDEVLHVVCDGCHVEMQRYMARLHRQIGKLDKLGLFSANELLAMLCDGEHCGQILNLLAFTVPAGEGCPKPPEANGLLDFNWIHQMATNAAIDAALNLGWNTCKQNSRKGETV